MQNHTPTPWTNKHFADATQIITIDGTPVAETCRDLDYCSGNGYPDSTFIVQAVNHFEQLRDACQAAHNALCKGSLNETGQNAVDKLHTVIMATGGYV